MSAFFLTCYVLVWPAVVLCILAVICRAFYQEWRQARREGRSIV